ncbi:MAG: 4-hydroxy-3-methylbut-2-enyl diphosphate reductase [Omnitrophica bacterium RIFCSPLOWO2_12_FULL_44_17]|uniref:4-hydroxy-3-methylbut-2-enyl diphosphate reductase n=1 Tax=Candidatus Danuiimicrobium aquiferis TaxID=1801832 RepID=A0A1G1L333_9BACT|nr:MAG: 4-hydroxy-3-methylbut-2-enyl diphosphate reductase [Omnitrophica bacterium RIFCSPHIGHO2_02_FULL_45_28]OGW99571.1 MAG: 4-hydroxy-3-methylbut-2-enyl diphosphate reductase [Omnitrophica bacterium RIFCSPLOWO2_12_FULL_44_17]
MKEKKANINRIGFGLKKEIKPMLNENYRSSLIEQIRASNYELAAGDLTICLAREFGFCYGVDRAVDLAYETRQRFPEKTIYLLSEIIHNQRVNSKLAEMGIKFLSEEETSKIEKNLSLLDAVTHHDAVLVPAFGASVEVMERLRQKGCLLVDTTCGSVVAVWRQVERYAQEGFTALIHGKFNHEETQATCSRVTQYPKGKFIVVSGKKQAGKVCEYVLGQEDRKSFLDEFSKTSSSGFDPDRDLERIGCANQTTMLSGESMEIAGMIESAMKTRYGEKDLNRHFCHFETICRATQDRQDSILQLAGSRVDLIIVVGGYNSSNTGHLCKISNELCPAYHVQDADEIISKNEIRHKPVGETEVVTGQNWLPEGKVRIGITAGASTPDRVTEEVILRVIQCAKRQTRRK